MSENKGAPMQNRDPRIDPRQGDKVTVGDETREVENVRDGRVYYSWPGKLAVRSVFPSQWQAWTSNASSWHAAEQETV